MSCTNPSSPINKTFIFKPIEVTGGTPTYSACTGIWTDEVFSCSGNTSINLGTGEVVINGDLNIGGIISNYGGNSNLVGKFLSGTTSGFVLADIDDIKSPNVLYTNSGATPTTIGGIVVGSTFNGQSMQEMWDALLYPYQYPEFTAFDRDNISSGDYELGETISGGTQLFNWSLSNGSNVLPNSVNIIENYTSSILMSNGANDGSESLNTTSYTRNTAGSTTLYTIEAKNTQNGNIPIRIISKSWSGRWYWGVYQHDSISNSGITTVLNTELTTGVVGNYKTWAPPVNSSDGYYGYLIIPDYLTQPTDLRNSVAGCSGNNIPFTILSATTFNNDFGVSQTYNIYRTNNAFNSPVDVWLCSP